jgi:type IV pilus assembly protein PilY1
MDVIRKILYGGTRSTDTTTQTIVDASFLSNDAHGWAIDVLADNRWENETPMSIYYDVSKFTPYAKPNKNSAHFFHRGNYGNNVVRSLIVALNVTTPARFYNFISHESTIPGFEFLKCPKKSDKDCTTFFEIRVEVCNRNSYGESENCREYPNGELKPIGLLQKYGENGDMYFGLLTGSFGPDYDGDYSHRLKGGILRNHIDHLSKAINPQTGQINDNSLIRDIDSLRLVGRYDTKYNNSAYWGNPVGEMLYEGVRYFARLTQKTSSNANPYLQPTDDFDPGDSEYVRNA